MIMFALKASLLDYKFGFSSICILVPDLITTITNVILYSEDDQSYCSVESVLEQGTQYLWAPGDALKGTLKQTNSKVK